MTCEVFFLIRFMKNDRFRLVKRTLCIMMFL